MDKTPKDWLRNINFGPGSPPADGISFITGELIPFLVSGSLFVVFILSLIFLLIGGIMYITSGGNKEGTAKARATITYALVGLALALSSFIILGILGQFFGVNLLGATSFCSRRDRALGICD